MFQCRMRFLFPLFLQFLRYASQISFSCCYSPVPHPFSSPSASIPYPLLFLFLHFHLVNIFDSRNPTRISKSSWRRANSFTLRSKKQEWLRKSQFAKLWDYLFLILLFCKTTSRFIWTKRYEQELYPICAFYFWFIFKSRYLILLRYLNHVRSVYLCLYLLLNRVNKYFVVLVFIRLDYLWWRGTHCPYHTT